MKRRDFLAGSASFTGGLYGVAALAQSTPCPPPSLSVNSGQTVASACIPPAQATGGVPAWYSAQTSGTWATIATAGNINAVVPVPQPNVGMGGRYDAIVNSWSGGSIDQVRREYLLTANGGHADYPGNEVYALALSTATPAWRRLTDPTPNDQMPQAPPAPTEGNGLYNDGRPRSMHNTFQEFANGKVWMVFQNSVTSGAGGDYNRVVAFNRNDEALLAADGTRGAGGNGASLPWSSASIRPWELYGPVSGLNSATCAFGRGVYNPTDKYVYGLGGKSNNSTNYWRVNVASGNEGVASASVFANHPSGLGRFSTWAVCLPEVGPAGVIVAGDAALRIIGLLDCSKFNQPGAWSIVPNVTGTGYFSPDQFGGSDGVYFPQFRQIAVGDPTHLGGRIYKLQVPAGNTVAALLSGTWAWTNFLPGGAVPGTSMPGSNGAGAWGRFRGIEMAPNQWAIVFVGGVAAPTYVYKVPTAGLP